MSFVRFAYLLLENKVKTGVDQAVDEKIDMFLEIHNIDLGALNCYLILLKNYKSKEMHTGVILSLPSKADA